MKFPTQQSDDAESAGIDVAVIILTFNEEANIPATLDSVKGWAREVFIVDSYSTDRTVDIVLSPSNEHVTVVQHAFEDYSKQWNWALAHLPIRSTWTLKLDADERVTESFKTEVTALVRDASPDLEGVYFRRRIVFMGKALRWGGVTENYDLRMWRTGCGRFEDRAVNEHALVAGHTVRLSSFVLHANNKSVADWIDKHNRYSSLEALSVIEGNVTGDVKPKFFGTPEQRRIRIRTVFYRVPFRALLHFVYRYILRGGILDGRSGFWYSFLKSVYLYWIGLKIAEYERTGIAPLVMWPVRGNPHQRVPPEAVEVSSRARHE
jgi:glycosyltransferase involved in cell wall biosynthesis